MIWMWKWGLGVGLGKRISLLKGGLSLFSCWRDECFSSDWSGVLGIA